MRAGGSSLGGAPGPWPSSAAPSVAPWVAEFDAALAGAPWGPPPAQLEVHGDLWGLGVFYSLLSTLLGTVGKDLFRLAFVTGRRHYHLLGFLLAVVIDPLLNIAALSHATQAIVSACAGFVIVWNVLLAPFVLSEHMTRIRLIASALILGGTVGVGLSGPHYEVVRTEAEYIRLFSEPGAITFFLLLALACGMFLWRWRSAPLGDGRPWGAVLGGAIAGNAFFLKAAIAIIGCSMHSTDRASKGCLHDNPWGSWEIYVIGALAILAAAGGLFVLALTLRHAEALDAVTIFTGVQIVSSALSANIVLHENQMTDGWCIMIYCMSLGVILVGLTLLAIREMKYPFEVEDEEVEWYARLVDAVRGRSLECWWRLRGVELHLEDGLAHAAAPSAEAKGKGGGGSGPVEGTALLRGQQPGAR